ncbi:MAG: alpha/beta fold hydrolase, partial [Planctomycetota bacterium]
HIAESLRALTPAPCLLDAAPWRAWWDKHQRDPDFRPADEEPQRGEYEGIILETRTVAPIPRQGGRRRPPPHVLVLPQFGWSTAAFGPYLLPLREHAAITWVRLPGVQTLTGRSGYGSDIPTYPVGRLVRALEKFRAARKIESFVILAHGASGWIAMRTAITYRDRCAGLILVDTPLDADGYRRILQYAAARGTKSERFVARTLTHQNNVPFNQATLDRIHALGLARGFHDPADLEIAWLFSRAREPQGFAIVPEIKWARHREVAVPSLFFYSAAGAFSGHRDADRIQRHFTRSIVAPVSQARGMPFVEENPKFHEVIHAFLVRFGFID